MKTKTVRTVILVFTCILCLLGMLLGMAVMFGTKSNSISVLLLGASSVLILFNAAFLFIISTEKSWWKTRDELDKSIENQRIAAEAFEAAGQELKKWMVGYHYEYKKLKENGKTDSGRT